MGISVSDLRAKADMQPIDEHEAGTIIRVGRNDSGPHYSGLEVIIVEYDPEMSPSFTARFTQMLGGNEVAAADDLDTILAEASEAVETYFS